MSHEEIDLESGATIKSDGQPVEQTAGPTVRFDIDKEDLASEIAPGMDNTQLVDAILSISQEKFIPYRSIELPSRGIYYNWPNGMVDVRGMSQTTEAVMSDQSLVKTGQALDYVFRECVKLPNGMDPVDLIVGDRIFLLYYIRGRTFGNVYEFVLPCGACNKESPYVYDLNDLASTIIYANHADGVEPFEIQLPGISETMGQPIRVGVRFARGRDTKTQSMPMRSNTGISKAHNKSSNNPFSRIRERNQAEKAIKAFKEDGLKTVVVSVQGVHDPARVEAFIKVLGLDDRTFIWDWLRTHTPGPDTMIEVDCPKCGEKAQVMLPITDSFFRKSKHRADGS